jgi:hypothetical protein
MDFSGINLGELIVAALANFVIGFFWYGDFLFGKQWRKLSGVGEEEPPKGKMALMFGLSFVLNFIIASFLSVFTEIAMMIGSNALFGGIMGMFLALGFVATTFGINYMYAQRPLKLYLIDVGYMLVSFFVMGVIIGAWY